MDDSTVEPATASVATARGGRGGQDDALRLLPALRRLSDREVANLGRAVEHLHVRSGEVVVREGDGARDAYVIAEGVARVTVAGSHICDLVAGEVVGEMAMLDGRPRTATVTAATPMTLLPVGPSYFYCFGGLPPVAIAVLKSLTDRLRAADARLASFALPPDAGAVSAQER